MTTASDYSDYVFYWVKTWKLLFSGGELTFDEAGEIFPDGRMSKYSVVGGLPHPPSPRSYPIEERKILMIEFFY